VQRFLDEFQKLVMPLPAQSAFASEDIAEEPVRRDHHERSRLRHASGELFEWNGARLNFAPATLPLRP
jgi:hypothetical protein